MYPPILSSRLLSERTHLQVVWYILQGGCFSAFQLKFCTGLQTALVLGIQNAYPTVTGIFQWATGSDSKVPTVNCLVFIGYAYYYSMCNNYVDKHVSDHSPKILSNSVLSDRIGSYHIIYHIISHSVITSGIASFSKV